jgi:hypothetical protein
MHGPGQRNHASHGMVLWQRRIDDVCSTASDHRVTTSGGQYVPEEKNVKPNQNTKVMQKTKSVTGQRLVGQEIVVNTS